MRSAPLLAFLLAVQVAAVTLAPAPAVAEGLEEEAMRQVSLARDDLEAGQYERAVAACDSALRLDPSREVQQEAFKIKGLALEQLERFDEARGMLLAFKSLRSGLPDDPEVEAALARMERPDEPPPEEREDPLPRREPRPKPKPPSESVLIPVLAAIAGAGVSGVGWALHGTAYNEASARMDLDAGIYFGSSASYETLYDRNKLGLQLGVGGAGVAGVGVALALVAATREASANTSASKPVPWVMPGPGGVVFGVAGTLP